MNSVDFAKAYHNALQEVVQGYGRVIAMMAAENAALRLKIAAIEADRAVNKEAAKVPPPEPPAP